MNEFQKTTIVTFDRTQESSIASALIRYQDLLRTRQAFIDTGCYMLQFNVAFMDISEGESRYLQITDSKYAELIVDALNHTPDGGFDISDVTSEARDLYISEAIFFAIALEYDGLKSVVRDTAQAMVDYSRFYNDTSAMWVDDMRVFGAEALYIMARLDPNDAVYLAQFFIPYWDDEHATGYELMFSSLVEEHGWSDAMMRAFVWCDSPEFRFAFYGMSFDRRESSYQPLGDFLQQNPERYPRFKALVAERFAAQPMLARYGEEDSLEDMQPVRFIYETLFAELCLCRYEPRHREGLLARTFIVDSLENEALDLERELRASIETPLVAYAGSVFQKNARHEAYEQRQAALYRHNGGINMINEFVASLPFGTEMSGYIYTGRASDVLEKLGGVNIWQQAKSHALTLNDVLDEACWNYGSNDCLRENLHEVLEHVGRSLLVDGEVQETELADGFVSQISVRAEGEEERREYYDQVMLRIVDMFYHLLGKQPLSDETCECLIGNDEYRAVISEEAFWERYAPDQGECDGPLNQRQQRQLAAVLGEFSDMDKKVDQRLLRQADKLSVERACYEVSRWDSAPDLGSCTLAAYLLHGDYVARVGDEQTMGLAAYISQDLFAKVCRLMLRQAEVADESDSQGLSGADVAAIEDYFTAQQTTLSQEEVLDLLNRHLHRDDVHCRTTLSFPAISEKQHCYRFFSYCANEFQRVVLCCYWLKQLSLPIATQAKRLWELLVAMAPVKVICQISQVYPHEGRGLKFANRLEEIEFYEMLNKYHGIAESYTLASELQQCRTLYSKERQYHALVELVDDLHSTSTSMFAQADKRRAQALIDGLDSIYECHKVNYHFHASLYNPDYVFELGDDFARAMQIFISLNANSWEEVLAQRWGKACLFKGFVEDLPKQYHLDINYHPEVDKLGRSRCDGYDWVPVTVMQRQGNRNVVIKTDRDLITTTEDIRLSGVLVLLDESIDHQEIIDAIGRLPTQPEREAQLHQAVFGYLSGEMSYDSVGPLFNTYLTDNLMAGLDNYGYNYSIGHFLWCIDEERRQRLLTLLGNHSYRGYKVIAEYATCGYMAELVRSGEWTLMDYLEANERDHRSAVSGWLVEKMLALPVERKFLVLWAIIHYRDSLGPFFVQLAANGELRECLSFLYPERREVLVDILAAQPNGKELLAIFDGESSRPVRDKLAVFLP
ncbi:hypothetical protein ABT56_14490 [Photobacterium aquae]|uniref:Uncharacterized protein n=1 Tax=Photobacterium aquae TaxID=1195763 RepID=A0A0J1GYB7_9GAMM|nr:hypothetical protein [Photobacterium aquae]KLV04661.1 hypothetical protein ABT56_14490 [Photobacterium aquae]